MGRVTGKVAVITGAASGLGAADAALLAHEGAKVVLTDVNEAAGAEVASGISGATFLKHDVRDEARWQQIIAETVARHGRLDVLVNNAGLVKFNHVEAVTLEEFRLQMGVMAEGTFLGLKHAIPVMAKGGGGSIVNMASIAAIKGLSSVFVYGAAKAAICAMTRSAAVHCLEQANGVRCNVLLPGAHDTPMTASALALLPPDYPGLDQIKKGQGRPEDVANLVLFLASDESVRINGAQLVIDQGETIR